MEEALHCWSGKMGERAVRLKALKPPLNIPTFAEKFPQLLKYWSQENILSPHEVSSNSGKKIIWTCEIGHSWREIVNNFTNRAGKCYYCSGSRTLLGFNDIGTTHPELLKEWDYALSGSPESYRASQDAKVFWKCLKENHSYEMLISSKVFRKFSCTYCSGKSILTGFNDLASQRPDLMVEWSAENEISPHLLFKDSTKSVLWNCSFCGVVYSRAPRGKHYLGCLKCRKKVYPELLSKARAKNRQEVQETFADIYPELLEEWDFEKNSDSPIDFAPKSNRKAWWKCSSGHSWFASIANRSNLGSGCPKCSLRRSLSEVEVAGFIESLGYTVIANDRKSLSGLELDILIPDLNLAVEYNGIYWHSTEVTSKVRGVTASEESIRKLDLARAAGLELAFVWEDDWKDQRESIEKALRKLLETGVLSPLLSKLAGPRG